MSIQNCVGTYLTTRLQQLGVKCLFAVPGDYTSDFLEIVDEQSSITRIATCNELNAGYAADGYARVNGIGAVAVTTGVGSFSLLNAIGGSFVEHVPVVAVVGTLSNFKLQDEVNAGILFHHNVNSSDTNKRIYENVTVAYERISDPLMAPAQIDNALTICISRKGPVVIEIMEDCYYMPCPAPSGQLSIVPPYESWATLQQMASASPANPYALQIVNSVSTAAQQIYQMLANSQKPVFWIGNELALYDLEDLFLQLQKLVPAPYATSLSGKSALPENNPWFIGTDDGLFTSSNAGKYLQASDCVISLGVWNTDLNNFIRLQAPYPGLANVDASRNMVKIQNKQVGLTDVYVQVTLENLLNQLIALATSNNYQPVWNSIPAPPQPPVPPSGANITYDYFYDMLDSFITDNDVVVSDVGLSLFGGASNLVINSQYGFLSQSIWASIGWSVPAALGASFATNNRIIVVVGDGAFKLTCQEISSMIQNNSNIVVFVLNNNVYAVEQMLLNPAPFEQGSNVPFEAANILQPWNYESLMMAFSGNTNVGMAGSVNTVTDLKTAFYNISNNQQQPWLVSINLSKTDYPAAWAPFVPAAKTSETAKEEVGAGLSTSAAS